MHTLHKVHLDIIACCADLEDIEWSKFVMNFMIQAKGSMRVWTSSQRVYHCYERYSLAPTCSKKFCCFRWLSDVMFFHLFSAFILCIIKSDINIWFKIKVFLGLNSTMQKEWSRAIKPCFLACHTGIGGHASLAYVELGLGWRIPLAKAYLDSKDQLKVLYWKRRPKKLYPGLKIRLWH